MTVAPHTEHERLVVLVARWKTEGWTRAAAATLPARIEATDTYERLPGGALLHRVDAHVGDQKVEGAEIIGYAQVQGSTWQPWMDVTLTRQGELSEGPLR